MIFETHAHYDDAAFAQDRDLLLGQFPEKGIVRVVNISSSLKSCRKTLELADRYSYVYAAVGIHPGDTKALDEESFAWLRQQCGHPKCVAVGEIGLDYYWDEPERETQQIWFRRQIALAKELGLPLVIHSRDAAQDTIRIMEEEDAAAAGGVIHCFSYTKETARIFLDMGFYIGIGGVVTFKNGKKLKEAVAEIPLERIVLETDSPYLAPEPNRGKRNSSLNLPYIVKQIAELKNVTPQLVEEVSFSNALGLYPRVKESLFSKLE